MAVESVLANGAIAAHLAWNQTAPKACVKQRGRFVDADRKVCEEHPDAYKHIRWMRCESCGCQKNKGHKSNCVQCNAGAPAFCG